MNLDKRELTTQQIVQIDTTDRWQAYHRLQTLDINCSCAMEQPLKVEVNSPLAAIQLWSVVRQITASRSELVLWLDNCWCIPTSIKD